MPCLPDHSPPPPPPLPPLLPILFFTKLSADTTVYSVGGRRRTGHYKLKIIILLPQTSAYARAHDLHTCSRPGLTHACLDVLTARAYARARLRAHTHTPHTSTHPTHTPTHTHTHTGSGSGLLMCSWLGLTHTPPHTHTHTQTHAHTHPPTHTHTHRPRLTHVLTARAYARA